MNYRLEDRATLAVSFVSITLATNERTSNSCICADGSWHGHYTYKIFSQERVSIDVPASYVLFPCIIIITIDHPFVATKLSSGSVIALIRRRSTKLSTILWIMRMQSCSSEFVIERPGKVVMAVSGCIEFVAVRCILCVCICKVHVLYSYPCATALYANDNKVQDRNVGGESRVEHTCYGISDSLDRKNAESRGSELERPYFQDTQRTSNATWSLNLQLQTTHQQRFQDPKPNPFSSNERHAMCYWTVQTSGS